MVGAALKIALVYWIIEILDVYVLSWQCLLRPIVVAPLTGLVLGDFHTGIIMGASLESVFMGISAIGGSIPADPTTGSIIAVAFSILTGADMEAAFALAMPIGTAMQSINSLFTPLWASLSPKFTALATGGNIRKFNRFVWLITCLQVLVPSAVLFLAVAYGVEGLESLLAALPSFVMRGLSASSSMMLAIGFAILVSMTWSQETGYFFFVGYVLVKYLNMPTLAVAILGAAIAATIFLAEKRDIDLDNKLKKLSAEGVAAGKAEEKEEDFF
jgi:PTS system mannose-specific IIC component/fructoselysine and glucoselysine-specific PTS system IIC component